VYDGAGTGSASTGGVEPDSTTFCGKGCAGVMSGVVIPGGVVIGDASPGGDIIGVPHFMQNLPPSLALAPQFVQNIYIPHFQH